MKEHNAVDYSLKWHVMAAVAMGVFLGTIDGSIVNVALPTLVEDLQTDFPTVQWVVLGYLLTTAILMLSAGRAGDMIGKKPIYMLGFVIFTTGSVLCGLAPSVQWLIAFRVLQAVGASMTSALGMAIITEAFPPQERGKALGFMGTIVSIGIVVGPTVGGIIVDAISWHWIFFVNLPVGIVGILMVLRYVPNFKPLGKQTFDYLGAATMLISLLSLLLGLTLGQRLGFGNPAIVTLFIAFVFFLNLFIAIELRVPQPMVDLRLFKNLLFSVNLFTGLLVFVALTGTTFLMPFFLQGALGYQARIVGLLMATIPIFLGVTAPVAGSLSDRYGTRPMTVIGMAIMVIGYIAMHAANVQMPLWELVVRIVPLGLGMGIFQSPNNSAVMGSAPRERLGVASGLLSITRALGQTIGVAVIGTTWANRVFWHAGETLAGGATTAPIPAQVSGLQDVFLVLVGLIACALGAASWAWRRERQLARLPATQPSD